MFSPVTMASSTTTPSTRMKANRLTMLMVTPSQGSSASAPAKRDGDAHAHPQGDRETQEQREQREHQQAALQRAVGERLQTRLDDARAVAPVAHADAGREALAASAT